MSEGFVESIMQTRVTLREVGMREGLQSNNTMLPTEFKAELFKGLVAAGCREINAVAFVGAHKMPHMADAEAILEAVKPWRDGINISALVPNTRGMERALRMHEAGLLDTALLVFTLSAHALQANGMTVGTDDLLLQIERDAAQAHAAGLKVVVFVSAAFGDNLLGWVDPRMIREYAARISAMPGVSELLISDSTGQGDPLQVYRFFCDLAEVLPTDRRIGLHMHDTRGAGLANIAFALASPFEHFVIDTAFGGWGGDYPFVDDSFGNVATEDVVEMLSGMGLDTGVDVAGVLDVTRLYAARVNRAIGSKLHFSSGPLDWKRARLPLVDGVC